MFIRIKCCSAEIKQINYLKMELTTLSLAFKETIIFSFALRFGETDTRNQGYHSGF